ncbi:hypothetical protein [Bradyrhizobium sp. USDA 4353]
MKAAVLMEVNKPLVIEDISVPKSGPRELLIRTGVASGGLDLRQAEAVGDQRGLCQHEGGQDAAQRHHVRCVIWQSFAPHTAVVPALSLDDGGG